MRHTKLIWTTIFILLLLPLLLLLYWGFCLPAQYGDTFLGELRCKYQRLEETEGPRIILVGGSAVAFGVDSGLLEAELDGYTAVNFGLYGGLGTQVMLELSADQVRPGDLVILMPEQEAQSLSTYFDAETMWQAVDGAFSLLAELDTARRGEMIGAFPSFAARKFRFVLEQSAPLPQGVYARSSFDDRGDVVSSLCAANSMPGGYDTNTPISFSQDILSADFLAAVNEYAEELTAQGATVWYHFPPINALAVEDGADPDGYFDFLQSRLRCQVIGNPKNSILEAGWFYDTNFHLNASGKTVFTRQLVRDIKAVLGDSSPTEIAVLSMPEGMEADVQGGDNSDADCFLYETLEDGVRVIGLTEEGRLRTQLTLPTLWNGKPVTALAASTFSGHTEMEEITLPASLAQIEDGAFSGCTALKRVILQHTEPGSCRVGQGLLDGTQALLYVPAQELSSFKVNYFWSVYAEQILALED